MGKATLARQKAIGAIGPARVQRLTGAGLTVLETDEYDKLTTRLAELERETQELHGLLTDIAELYGVTVEVVKGAMGTR